VAVAASCREAARAPPARPLRAARRRGLPPLPRALHRPPRQPPRRPHRGRRRRARWRRSRSAARTVSHAAEQRVNHREQPHRCARGSVGRRRGAAAEHAAALCPASLAPPPPTLAPPRKRRRTRGAPPAMASRSVLLGAIRPSLSIGRGCWSGHGKHTGYIYTECMRRCGVPTSTRARERGRALAALRRWARRRRRRRGGARAQRFRGRRGRRVRAIAATGSEPGEGAREGVRRGDEHRRRACRHRGCRSAGAWRGARAPEQPRTGRAR
jgi:hypothetical protein